MKLKYDIDFKGLEEYLKNLSYKDDIETCWNNPENPKLIKGKSIDDIEYFKMDKSKIALESIIDYGTPFLLDAVGNDLSIVILSRKKYRLPTGRVIRAKFVATIVDDCRKYYGTALNGYWIIPSQFIKRRTLVTVD